jgi:hypothetical protein
MKWRTIGSGEEYIGLDCRNGRKLLVYQSCMLCKSQLVPSKLQSSQSIDTCSFHLGPALLGVVDPQFSRNIYVVACCTISFISPAFQNGDVP